MSVAMTAFFGVSENRVQFVTCVPPEMNVPTTTVTASPKPIAAVGVIERMPAIPPASRVAIHMLAKMRIHIRGTETVERRSSPW